MNKTVWNYLKDNNYDLSSSTSDGINISASDNEVLIKGSKVDLVELADYIINIAVSDNDIDHIHIDNLTLINKNSTINNLIIEKI